MKRLLMMLLMMIFIATGFAQNINRAEYFFDHDPAPGNGTAIAVNTPGDIVNFTANIPLTGLSNGFHTLAIRVSDAAGKWSGFDYRGFYIFSTVTTNTSNITGAEYFFDHDPGPGNGTSTSVGATGAVVNFTAAIPANIAPGFHWLGLRTRDADGKWGLYERRNFYLTAAPVDMTAISAAEYFYDHDPGPGNGSPLTVTSPGFTISQLFSIPVPGNMSAGTHLLTLRVKDVAGKWSLFAKDSITVGNVAATISCPANVVVNATPGQCSAVVNNIDAIISPAGSSYTYTCTGATTGSGTGTVSGKSFNTGVTTVTYALTNSPGVNCSFMVTVNANNVASVSITASATTICQGGTVVFTANPVNGGNNPNYQWKHNGVNAGTDSIIYQTNQLNNGDVISVVMSASNGCGGALTDTSNAITIAVTPPYITPTVNITSSASTICPGTLVTFHATSTNGGVPNYAWQVNGITVAFNSDSYQSSTLVNGDKVRAVLTSSLACVTAVTTVSEEILMTVIPQVVPGVSIATSSTSICAGSNATFTAIPTQGGANPSYQWRLNGINVGQNNPVYENTNLNQGDVISVIMTSSLGCASPQTAVSNGVTMTVNQSITPAVSMSASSGTICAGATVTFYAAPISGAGTSPSYQWKLNGNNVGTNSDTYQNSSLRNGDVVRVAMTSSLGCATPQTVLSHDSATMIVDSVIAVPSVSILSSSSSICANTTVTFSAVPVNGGEVPSYQWRLNGNNVGNDDSLYQNAALINGDVVSVIMSSSLGCANPLSDTASMTMTVAPSTTYYADLDGDGYGDAASGTTQACSPQTGYVTASGDCDDFNAAVHPGATEIGGNGIDENCNGTVDETSGDSLPMLVVKTYPVKEGDIGATLVNIKVDLNSIAESVITLHYFTMNGDAVAGLDYTAASGTLVIPAGWSSGTIQLRIIGDLLDESNERFWLKFSNPVNVLLPADPRSWIMIQDDDKEHSHHTTVNTDQPIMELVSLKIPNVTRRNQVWMIPQIGNYKNEVMIMNAQGQMVNRFINYRNQEAIKNVSAGLYFYQVRIIEANGAVKNYSGRLLVTE